MDISGVSWGGGLAQQFAFQYPSVCRKLILAATAPGFTMVPGKPNVLSKMASPRRYTDPGYLRSIAADIYGGAFRTDPTLIGKHAAAMKGATQYGYMLQLLAMSGWTSLPWLWLLRQPTLILSGNDDPLVPMINAKMMHQMISKSRLEVIDDGHLFMVTKPRETAEIIEGVLEGVGSRFFSARRRIPRRGSANSAPLGPKFAGSPKLSYCLGTTCRTKADGKRNAHRIDFAHPVGSDARPLARPATLALGCRRPICPLFR